MTAANLATLKDAVPGVYMAYCKHNGHTYKAAVSIGWNPFYDNDVKTLEAYLISSEELPDFYGQQVTVQLRRYIRPEALFDTFDGLLIAISCDIQATIDTEF
jgi:riboflavin kinase